MKTVDLFSYSEIPNILIKIRNNQLKYKCIGFIASVPQSKCLNCDKHYLSHTNEETFKSE